MSKKTEQKKKGTENYKNHQKTINEMAIKKSKGYLLIPLLFYILLKVLHSAKRF